MKSKDYHFQLLTLNTLKPFVKRSILWHLLLVFLLVLVTYLSSHYNKLAGEKRLVLAKASVRVDIVAMPQLTVKELKKLDLSAKSKKGAKAVKDEFDSSPKISKKNSEKSLTQLDDPNAFLKSNKKDKKKENKKDKKLVKKDKSFDDLIKNYQAKNIPNKKQKKAQKDTKKKAKDNKSKTSEKDNTKSGESNEFINQDDLSELLYMGNKLSSGSAKYGDLGNQDLSEVERYASLLPEHVRPYWRLPSYLLNKNLQCRIRVFINSKGKLIKTIVYKSSGDQEYDQKAIEALKNSQPFPKVPASIRSSIVKGSVLLGFPL